MESSSPKSLFASSTRKSNRLRLVLILGTALLLMGTTIVSYLPDSNTPIKRLDNASRDFAMRLRGVRTPDPDIAIVAIDDFSLSWHDETQWPWPRTHLAKIVDQLNKAGARVVGIDILLFEPDPDPAGDQALAEALRNSQASVTVMQYFRSDVVSENIIAERETMKLPLPVYQEVLDGMGITTVFLDEDAVMRGIQVYQRTKEGEIYYNWAFAVANAVTHGSGPEIHSATYMTYNGQRVPLYAGNFLVNYSGPAGTYPTYSAVSVELGDIPAEAFRDKIVLIGATSLTLQDIYATPFSSRNRTAGVEIVANAVDTLLNERFLQVAPPWVGLLLIVLAALLASQIVRSSNPSLTITLMTIGLLGYAAVFYLLFLKVGLYLPFIGPESMLFLGVVLPTLEQAVSQELEKRRVRSLFTRFISPEMVDQMITTQDIASLNKRANLTILFSDIRGFTTLSEALSPEEVVALLNPYLEVMTEVIYKYGGTVDKYEGDAIIAFFGEPVSYPDHAQRAVRTAIEMRQALTKLKQRWAAEGRLPEYFEIGIGINSGDVFVGMLGSAQRVNYTVIGDNVNLTARLQDLTKTYAWPILITENTYQQVKDEFDTEFVDAVIMRGKSETIRIYKVLGRQGASAEERVKTLQTRPQ